MSELMIHCGHSFPKTVKKMPVFYKTAMKGLQDVVNSCKCSPNVSAQSAAKWPGGTSKLGHLSDRSVGTPNGC